MSRSRLWLLPVLLVALVGGAWYFDAQGKKGDRELDVYVTGGRRMAAGEEIYRRGADGKPFTYPPFAAVPFVPFASLPESWHSEAWFVVNFLILLGVIRFLHRYATSADSGRGPPRLWWFWVVTAAYGGRHVVSVFTNQSNDLLILGLVCLVAASWSRARPAASMWSGVWAGLGAAMKATPLLFVGLFGLRMRWLALAAMFVAIAAATLLPDALWPRADGDSWWHAWYAVNLQGLEVGGTAEAQGAWHPHSVLNQSLGGATRRLFTPLDIAHNSFVVGEQGDVLLVELSPGMHKAVTLLLQVGVLAVIAFAVLCAKRAVRAAGDAAAATQRRVALGEVAAFACGMVLLSPQSSKSHFCVWLFPVAFVMQQLLRGHRDRLALLLFVGSFVLAMLSKGLLGRDAANLLLAYGNVTWATLLLLLATTRCLQVVARDVDR
ncbi:MAG: DUF2029 domain-containing protein [Planctomycetes bacterium]|nr:DUF2029 domain-containing protein [Planctomycetota bacterium]